MNAVFKKLNYRDQSVLHIINPPQRFEPALAEMREYAAVETTLAEAKTVTFFLAFATRQSEVDHLARAVVPLLDAGSVLWFAYPKGSSKKYKCEFNRDNGWTTLGELGFEGVRMVAIDEDWSALRFKPAKEIKSMTRAFAMSNEGKKKVAAAILKKKV